MRYPTFNDMRPLFPHARREILTGFLETLPKADQYLGTVRTVSHFIAECGVESDHFVTYEEYASGAAYEGLRNLGNIYPGDGRRYKGHGPIQITGRANHRKCTPFVQNVLHRPELDLEATPMLLVTDKAVGFMASLWYWCTLGKTHFPTDGGGLSPYAEDNNASAVARGINRGNPHSVKRANHEDERIALTERVLAVVQRLQTGHTPTSEQTLDPSPRIPPILKEGSRGEDVSRLQAMLALPVDGIFGAGTRKAVEKFQKKAGLSIDGVVGDNTWGALLQAAKGD